MTEANKRANLADALAQSARTFLAADALAGLALAPDAVGRGCYAVFHLVEALLFSRGLQAKTHKGLFHLFNVEFVVPGTFTTDHNDVLTEFQKLRESADYKPAIAITITIETARAWIARAHDFDKLVRDWLAANGWT